jgi:hypothetical protein
MIFRMSSIMIIHPLEGSVSTHITPQYHLIHPLNLGVETNNKPIYPASIYHVHDMEDGSVSRRQVTLDERGLSR